MILKITAGMCMVALECGIAGAADFVDNAPVVSVTPIVQSVSQQVCQPQAVVNDSSPPQGNGIVGGIIGGLAGGLLGSQVGHGNGKTAATIAGAAGGAIVGNHIATSPSTPTSQTVMTCSNVLSNVVMGYTVVYFYNGRNVTASLPYAPGRYVKVSVGVINEGGAPERPDNSPMSLPPPLPLGY